MPAPYVKDETEQTTIGIILLNSERPATGPNMKNAPFEPAKQLRASHRMPQHLASELAICRLVLCLR